MSSNLPSVFNLTSTTSNVTAYPQGLLNRSSYYRTLFDTTLLPYNKQYNNIIFFPSYLCYKIENSIN